MAGQRRASGQSGIGHGIVHPETCIVDDVVPNCVANMPGAVPRTSTFALNNARLPFILELAIKGAKRAMAKSIHRLRGLNVHAGKVTCQPVAEGVGFEYVPAEKAPGL